MFGTNFPVSDYYKDGIVTGRTISRTGRWWSAVLVIRDPRSGKKFLGAYKWQHVGDIWKVRSKWNVRSQKDAQALADVLVNLKSELVDQPEQDANKLPVTSRAKRKTPSTVAVGRGKRKTPSTVAVARRKQRRVRKP